MMLSLSPFQSFRPLVGAEVCSGALPFPCFPGKKVSVGFLFLKPSDDF